MKKFILSISALLAGCACAFAQTGRATTSEYILNSGSLNLLISGTTTATGSINLGAQPSAGDYVTISSTTSGTQSYTFVTALSGTTNQIVIGGTVGGLNGTLIAIESAIGGSGTLAGMYVSTGVNANVTGTSSGNSIILTATATGTAGNNVSLGGSFASRLNTFSGPALTGGTTATGTNTFTLFNLPATTGTYVFDAADVVMQSGTLATGTSTDYPILQFLTSTGTASGTLALGMQPRSGDSFTTGTQTYTYTGTLTGNYQILLGTSALQTVINTGSAIGNSGTTATYQTPAVNVYATATYNSGTTGLVFTATNSGTSYNVATTSSFTAPYYNFFYTPTLVGGYTGVIETGTVEMSGSLIGLDTHVSGSTSPLPLIIVPPGIGPGGLPVKMTVVSGTATKPVYVKVYVKGYHTMERQFTNMQITIPQPSKVVTVNPDYTYTFTDSFAKKTVTVNINTGVPGQPAFSFVLWSGVAYSEAGDYTQAQLNTAVAAYLASLKTAA